MKVSIRSKKKRLSHVEVDAETPKEALQKAMATVKDADQDDLYSFSCGDVSMTSFGDELTRSSDMIGWSGDEELETAPSGGGGHIFGAPKVTSEHSRRHWYSLNSKRIVGRHFDPPLDSSPGAEAFRDDVGVGDVYQAPNGITYVWDGQKWDGTPGFKPGVTYKRPMENFRLTNPKDYMRRNEQARQKALDRLTVKDLWAPEGQ